MLIFYHFLTSLGSERRIRMLLPKLVGVQVLSRKNDTRQYSYFFSIQSTYILFLFFCYRLQANS